MKKNNIFLAFALPSNKLDEIERRIKELETLQAQKKVGSYLSVIDKGVLNALRNQREQLLQKAM
ncbi:MAG: hypothetical protein JXB48_17420 [Candidatus Latescibacteria bacterium]|nr:hypothetical protein [Candidatus Latescibacterota bacterium]